jgi:hypothetical protein
VRAPRRRSRTTRIKPLPLQAFYRVGDLARASGVPHRQFQRLLKSEDVRVYRVGRLLLVPLTELEDKVPLLWESVKAAESLRRVLHDD